MKPMRMMKRMQKIPSVTPIARPITAEMLTKIGTGRHQKRSMRGFSHYQSVSNKPDGTWVLWEHNNRIEVGYWNQRPLDIHKMCFFNCCQMGEHHNGISGGRKRFYFMLYLSSTQIFLECFCDKNDRKITNAVSCLEYTQYRFWSYWYFPVASKGPFL